MFFAGSSTASSQIIDSLSVADTTIHMPLPNPVTKEKGNYNFKAKQLIAPLSAIVVGSVGLIPGSPVERLSFVTNREIEKHHYHTNVDEWLQYMPVAFHLGLGFTGVKSRHKFVDRVVVAATAYACEAILVNGIKYSVGEMRPDGTKRNSFPSGHTATAFTGAELVRIEYGNAIGAAAYAVSTAVGVLRVTNNRHWVHDVIAGAGIGILSARVGYWMLPVWKRLFKIKENDKAVSVMPWTMPEGNQYGATACVVF